MLASSLLPGDILIQYRGQPWCWLAWLTTGQPYPHAQIVSRVDPATSTTPRVVWVIENSADGLREKPAYQLDSFTVARPNCDQATKMRAIAWIKAHTGENYGYGHMLEIVFGYRLGRRSHPGIDDDVTQDRRDKVCSETIAMGYYRSGFDLVPHVCDRDTLPRDFLATPCMAKLGPIER